MMTESEIINLTQAVGKVGAARIHELGRETMTIFNDAELFEFARAIEREVMERCAKTCDARAEEHHDAWLKDCGPRSDELWEDYIEAQCCATAIRAEAYRGDAMTGDER